MCCCHTHWQPLTSSLTLMLICVPDIGRDCVLWGEPAYECWPYTWWPDLSNLRGTPEADGAMAEGQWRSHLQHNILAGSEWQHHVKYLVCINFFLWLFSHSFTCAIYCTVFFTVTILCFASICRNAQWVILYAISIPQITE